MSLTFSQKNTPIFGVNCGRVWGGPGVPMDIEGMNSTISEAIKNTKLLSDRGFLTYLCRNFPEISVWLKG